MHLDLLLSSVPFLGLMCHVYKPVAQILVNHMNVHVLRQKRCEFELLPSVLAQVRKFCTLSTFPHLEDE